ncbi:hypothetical protein MTO96_029019 [Rhipicephalus appendiculatus]
MVELRGTTRLGRPRPALLHGGRYMTTCAAAWSSSWPLACAFCCFCVYAGWPQIFFIAADRPLVRAGLGARPAAHRLRLWL